MNVFDILGPVMIVLPAPILPALPGSAVLQGHSLELLL